jgi:RNA polymerase sigma-70 factor (ECF subfamily)
VSRRSAELSDAQLVQRVRSGDPACYEQLLRRYSQRVYRVVRAMLRDDSEAEDVMQDAYLAAYRHLDGFAGRARFSTWLIRIAANQALDRLRKTGRFVPFDPTLEEARARLIDALTAALARDPEQQAGDRQIGRMLEHAIEALPPPYRMAYVLRELEGMSTADAAECLGVEEGTVKTRVHRARLLLREALGREVGDDASEVFAFGGERCDRVAAGVMERIAAAEVPRATGPYSARF